MKWLFAIISPTGSSVTAPTVRTTSVATMIHDTVFSANMTRR